MSRPNSRPNSARGRPCPTPGSRPGSALGRKITAPPPAILMNLIGVGPTTKSSKIYAKEIPAPKELPKRAIKKTVRPSTAPSSSLRRSQQRLQDSNEASPERPILQDLSKQNIIIHVYDENKSEKRAFHCKRNLLVREMMYFESALRTKIHHSVVEIDVHCDIQVFEWLMSYISRQVNTLSITYRNQLYHLVWSYLY
jgi:hypothetical protein